MILHIVTIGLALYYWRNNQKLQKRAADLAAKLDFMGEKLNVTIEDLLVGFDPAAYSVQQVRKLVKEGKVSEAKQLAKDRFCSVQQFKDAGRS